LEWKYAGVLAIIPLAFAQVMLGISQPGWAIVFIAASAVWFAVLWCRSRFVKRNQKISKRKTAQVIVRHQQIMGVLVVALIFGLLCFYVHRWGIEKELGSAHGWLIPASDPMPSAGDCGPAPDDALMLFIGNSVIKARTFPHPVLSVDGRGLVVLDKKEDGSVALTMDVLSTNGKIVARIEKNEFILNQNNYLRMKRPDLSSLTVEDQTGKQVLSARYLNSRAFKVEAVLNLPDVPSVYGPLDFTGEEKKHCYEDSGSVEFRTH
jgi:hypothetical protein